MKNIWLVVLVVLVVATTPAQAGLLDFFLEREEVPVLEVGKTYMVGNQDILARIFNEKDFSLDAQIVSVQVEENRRNLLVTTSVPVWIAEDEAPESYFLVRGKRADYPKIQRVALPPEAGKTDAFMIRLVDPLPKDITPHLSYRVRGEQGGVMSDIGPLQTVTELPTVTDIEALRTLVGTFGYQHGM